ncbi:MAG: glycoside hydrolase family 43 protein, partial [bacterium]|nr:glycoside hydrolase family 43 protein [bacterium]
GSIKGGLAAFKSADGIHWSYIRKEPVITKGAFDSQNLAFWDAVRGEYRDYHRGFQKRVRDIMTCTSKDFVNWTDPVWIDYGKATPEHLYTNAIRPYARAPHIFMGFPKRFIPSRRAAGNRMPGLSDGVFMTSRDGLSFKRWGEALIRPGLQPKRWVNRNNLTAWGIVETSPVIP